MRRKAGCLRWPPLAHASSACPCAATHCNSLPRSRGSCSQEKAALQDVFKRRGPGGGGEGGAFQLPPPDPQAAAPWGEQGGEQGWAAQRQWEQEQQQQEGAG